MNISNCPCVLASVMVVAALCAPRAAYAQQMNFSYYSDAYISEDDSTLYTVVDGHDFSSGCNHYDYFATGWVSGPSGYCQQGFPGLSTYVNVPLTPGTYSFGSDVIVNCSCFGSGLGAGGGYDTKEVWPKPSGEQTAAGQWTSATGHEFSVTLQGGTFDGRIVREVNGGGDVDTCHFPGSLMPKQSGTSGTSASIQNNRYADLIEMAPSLINWYRAYNNGERIPCQFETNQRMEINQPDGQWSFYKTNRLKQGIDVSHIWYHRDGVGGSTPY